ncbi:GTPase-activating protein BUD2 [Saccharomyces eubayanus]|uniref:GTPase-activating protein BUD2 n=1 Tax=Saccharomyces eubayanus TaxID=1080349 RepID=UPI0006C31F7D|nr:BUD2-like protein [Saccharomyces eubayanus]KOG98233.1 BUD2-like protein [Saccharomyces eubayanus]
MSSNNEPAQSQRLHFILDEFLYNIKRYKNTFEGEIQWCNDLSLNDWKTHYLQITKSGSLTHSIDELTADSANIQPIIKHLQQCELQITKDTQSPFIDVKANCNFIIRVKASGKDFKVYLRVKNWDSFKRLLTCLIWWSSMKTNGIFNKFQISAPYEYDTKKLGQPESLLVYKLNVFGPMVKHTTLPPATNPLDKPNISNNDNNGKGWFSAMGVFKSDGILDLLLQSDGSPIYSIDITQLLKSEIRILDSSVLQNDNCLFLGELPLLRKQLNDENFHIESINSSNNNSSNISEEIIIQFPLRIDLEDCFVALQSYARSEYLSITGSDKSNGMRISNSFKLSILEANFQSINLNDKNNTPWSIFTDITTWGHTWARTSMVPGSPNPFWREEFQFDELLRLDTSYLEIKQLFHDPIHSNNKKRLRLVGKIGITQEMINDARYNKETRLPIMDVDNQNFQIGTICIKLSSNLNFILPSTNFMKLEKLLANLNLSMISNLIYKSSSSMENDNKLMQISVIFLDIFQSTSRIEDWFNVLIDKELSKIDGTVSRINQKNLDSKHIFNSLFRGNSILTKSTEQYFFRVGNEYLNEALGGILKDIIESNESFELDPARIKEEGNKKEKILGDNYKRLYFWVTKIWKKLYATSNDLPIEIRNVLKIFRKKLEIICTEDILQIILNGISGLLFLRFFCPVILNPKLFKYVSENLNETSRRNLTLISKVLLNLSTLTRFANKEPWLMSMNHFIDKRRDELLEYIDKMTQKKLDFNSKKLNLSSNITRPKLPIDQAILDDLPQLPCLIDKNSRETELVNLIINFSQENGNKMLKDSQMEENGKQDLTGGDRLSTSSSINLSINRKDLDSPVGAKPEIGELEFERITENNTEVFGDDLMNLLKSDDGGPKHDSLVSSINNNVNPNSTFTTQEEERYMMKELEQECYLLYNKIDRITKRLSDYECASSSLFEDRKYSISLSHKIYYEQLREGDAIVLKLLSNPSMDRSSIKLRKFFRRGASSKLYNIGDHYNKFLIVEGIGTEFFNGTNRLSSRGTSLNGDDKDNQTIPSSSSSSNKSGLGNRFSPTKLSRMMRRAPNGDVPKEQSAHKLTRWFKKKKDPRGLD